MSDVTRLVQAIGDGDARATAELLQLVYDELRGLARAQMAAERPGQTLEATALVHEAYLRLFGTGGTAHFANRRHFFAAAAEAMRRILIENARRKQRQKHGGEHHRVELVDQPAALEDEQLLLLNAALEELSREDPVAAKVVELRQFAGLRHEQIAETLEITVYQARQKWTYARAWLRSALGE
jgi:RNA polymerase sigma factor (TIGR02999 family)